MTEVSAVEIHTFRSIVDSDKIPINNQTTVLVGANEAGKTNFLEALHKFRVGSYFDKHDYPFHIEKVANDSDPMITVYMTDVDLGPLDKLIRGPGISDSLSGQSDDVDITKRFDGSYSVEYNNHSKAVKNQLQSRSERVDNLVSTIKNEEQKIRQAIRRERIGHMPGQLLHPDVSVEASSLQKSREKISHAKSRLHDFRERLKDLDEEIPADLEQSVRSVNRYLSSLHRLLYSPGELLVDEYYNSIYKEGAALIQKEVDLADLNEDSDTFYFDILNFAEIPINQLDSMDTKERFDKKNKATTRLEHEFSRYWYNTEKKNESKTSAEENPVSFDLDFSGGTMSLHITNDDGSTDLVSHRSTGFRHFLSFYIRLLASNENMKDNLILLDSPGVHLHPGAQESLRKAIDRLAQDNQVIISTHSPFMINTDQTGQLRVVKQVNGDVDDKTGDGSANADQKTGTQINTLDRIQIGDNQADVLAPVRTSIGATFADSLFAGTANVLVEGATDKLLIEAFSRQFDQKETRPSIPYTVNILDFDGTKASYLIKVLEAEGYDYIVLLDSDAGGNSTRKSLSNAKIDQKSVVDINQLVKHFDESEETTIEDLFDAEYYCKLITEYHDEIEWGDISHVPNQPGGIIDNLCGELKRLSGEEKIENEKLPKGAVVNHIVEQIQDRGLEKSDISDETVENFDDLISGLTEKL